MLIMEEFYKDTLRFGCLACFKHFQLCVNGSNKHSNTFVSLRRSSLRVLNAC